MSANIQFIYYFNYSSLISNVSRQRSTVATLTNTHTLTHKYMAYNTPTIICTTQIISLIRNICHAIHCMSYCQPVFHCPFAHVAPPKLLGSKPLFGHFHKNSLHWLASCCFLLITCVCVFVSRKCFSINKIFSECGFFSLSLALSFSARRMICSFASHFSCPFVRVSFVNATHTHFVCC